MTLASAELFLAHYDPTVPGCVVLNTDPPGTSDLALLRELAERGVGAPIIFLSGSADDPTAQHALLLGAFDFLEKPFHEETLLDSARRAVDLDRRNRQQPEEVF